MFYKIEFLKQKNNVNKNLINFKEKLFKSFSFIFVFLVFDVVKDKLKKSKLLFSNIFEK